MEDVDAFEFGEPKFGEFALENKVVRLGTDSRDARTLTVEKLGAAL
jgi:hypothetical protein